MAASGIKARVRSRAPRPPPRLGRLEGDEVPDVLEDAQVDSSKSRSTLSVHPAANSGIARLHSAMTGRVNGGARVTAGWLVAPAPARYQAMLDAKAPGRAYTRARSSSWSGRQDVAIAGPVMPEVPEVGAHRVEVPVEELLGQRQAVEVLVPELALGLPARGPVAEAREGRRDDEGRDALGRAPRERLRNTAADVIAAARSRARRRVRRGGRGRWRPGRRRCRTCAGRRRGGRIRRSPAGRGR